MYTISIRNISQVAKLEPEITTQNIQVSNWLHKVIYEESCRKVINHQFSIIYWQQLSMGLRYTQL